MALSEQDFLKTLDYDAAPDPGEQPGPAAPQDEESFLETLDYGTPEFKEDLSLSEVPTVEFPDVDDPEKFSNSIVDSHHMKRVLGIDVQPSALVDAPEYADSKLMEGFKKSRTLVEEHYKHGVHTTQLDDLYHDLLDARETGKSTADIEAKIAAMPQMAPPGKPVYPWEKAAAFTAAQVPIYADIIKEGVGTGMAMGMLGGAAGAATTAGPGAVPAFGTFYAAGQTYGSGKAIWKMMEGNSYREMLDAGVDEKWARNLARYGVGPVSAGLNILSFGMFKKMAPVAVRKFLGAVTDKTSKGIMKGRAGKLLMATGTEVLTEDLEEINQIVMTEVGINLTNELRKAKGLEMLPGITRDEFVTRIKDVTEATLYATFTLGSATTTISYGADKYMGADSKKDDKENIIDMTAHMMDKTTDQQREQATDAGAIILGVTEDEEGNVTELLMADRKTGDIFETGPDPTAEEIYTKTGKIPQVDVDVDKVIETGDVESALDVEPRRVIEKSELVNGITRAAAGEMMAAGDEDVLSHIREGIEQHGVTLMQDAIRNQAIAEVAEVPKDQRAAVRERIAKLQPEIDKLFTEALAKEAKPDIDETAAFVDQISEALVEEHEELFEKRNADLRGKKVSEMTDAEKDAALGDKLVAEMTDDEKNAALLKADVTEMPNRRAWNEDNSVDPHQVQIAIDLDGLKFGNDFGGHPFGDSVLKHMAAVAGEVVSDAVRSYHFSGDEFVITAKNRGVAKSALVNLLNATSGTIMELEIDDHVFTYPLSFGFGTDIKGDFKNADKNLIRSKQAAKAKGEVADRGAPPIGISGRDAQGREMAPAEIAEFFERKKKEGERDTGEQLAPDVLAEEVLQEVSPQPLSKKGQLRSAVDKLITPKGRNNLNVEVVQSISDLEEDLDYSISIDNTVEGAFDPFTGKIYLVADNIAPDQVWTKLLHEGTHKVRAEKGWSGVFGKQAEKIMSDIDAKIEAGDVAWKDAEAQAIKAKTPDSKLREETITYFLADNTNKTEGLWKRIVAAIREWAIRHGFKKKNITDQDIVNLAEASVRRAALKRGVPTFLAGPRVMFSKNTDSEEFKNWSGGLEVLEGYEISDAKPNKGYVFRAHHGTTHEFDIFDPSIKGTKEGQFGAVNYFTSDEGDADQNYAGEGPDLTNRMERLQEQIATDLEFNEADEDRLEAAGITKEQLEKLPNDEIAKLVATYELSGGEPQTLEVFVKSENPALIGGDKETRIDVYDDFADEESRQQSLDEAWEEVKDENSLEEEDREDYEGEIDDRSRENEEFENLVLDAVDTAIRDSGNDPSEVLASLEIYDSEITATELEKQLRENEQMSYLEDPETGDLVGFHVIGQIFKELGFDSIILQNANERFPGMSMGSETAHIHVFEETPAHIKSIESAGFDPRDPRILFSKRMPEETKQKLRFRAETVKEIKTLAEQARAAKDAGDGKLARSLRLELVDLIGRAKSESATAHISTLSEKQKVQRRRQSINDIRDYFGLTDNDLKKISRKDVRLMSNYEFKKYKDEIQLKALAYADTRQAKLELLDTIHQLNLQKVDNFRDALSLPPIRDMNVNQLRDFEGLLSEFHEGDSFLNRRQIETVDHTFLKGIRTWREAKEKLAAESGVTIEELDKVKVTGADNFKWDNSLYESNPFYRVLVTRVTSSLLDAQMKAHAIESEVFDLAKNAEKSVKRSLLDRAIPNDKQIFDYLEANKDTKEVLAAQMTPEQMDLAHYMQEYFSQALTYLLETKSLSRGRENYFVHMRRTLLESIRDDGLMTGVKEMFKNYEQDQMGFNILDDNTGNILPLEKFFQFSLQRSGELTPTKNIVRAFLTYANTFEKKVALDGIIPAMSIYAQSLTPTIYTARGLEIDQSIKKFVNKWINNKKGRRISYDSVVKQGGKLDLIMNSTRMFVSMLKLGFSPIAQTAAPIGEQSANFIMMGVANQTKGTARMATKKGKRIVAKYEGVVGRSLFETLTAPGEEVTGRFTALMFAGFHAGSRVANAQYLLGMMTDQEYNAETISTERLTEMELGKGRFRAVPGSASLVGSTSPGKLGTQFKSWAIPVIRTTLKDLQKVAKDIKNKPFGEKLTSRESAELLRITFITGVVLATAGIYQADADDDTLLSKMITRALSEASLIYSAFDVRWMLFTTPPAIKWTQDLGMIMADMLQLVEYKDGSGLRGPKRIVQHFTPGFIKSLRKKKKKKKY